MRFIDPEVLPHFELPCKPRRERRTRGTVTDDTEQLTVRSAHVTTRVQQPASVAKNEVLVRSLQVTCQILNCGSPSSIQISTIFQADISDTLRTSPSYRGHTPRSCGRSCELLTLKQYAMVGYYCSPADNSNIAHAVVDVWKMMMKQR